MVKSTPNLATKIEAQMGQAKELWNKAFMATLYYGVHKRLDCDMSSDRPLNCNLAAKRKPRADTSQRLIKVAGNKVSIFKKE